MADGNEVTIEQLQESIKKLEANNSDLKKERNKFKDAAAKFEGVDLDALKAAADKLAKLENDKLEQDGEYKKLYEKLQNQHLDEIAAAKKAQADLQSKFDSALKMNDLTNALAAAKVDPVLMDVAATSLIGQVGLVEGKSMVGGKPVNEFIKEWAEGEVGKRFIPSGNSGAGAKGNESGGVQVEASYFDPKSPGFSYTKQGEVRKANPELAAKLAEKYAPKPK